MIDVYLLYVDAQTRATKNSLFFKIEPSKTKGIPYLHLPWRREQVMSTTTKERNGSSSSNISRELKIVSLLEWWNDASYQPRLPLLDVRNQNDYNEKCLHSPSDSDSSTTTSTTTAATIVHIPFTELEARCYELPPRHIVFCLILPDYSAIGACEEFLLGARKKSPQKPWLVPYAILASDPVNWQQAVSLGLGKEGLQPSPPSFRAMPRLWEPDPMVAQVLLPVLLENTMQDKDKHDDDHGSSVVETSEIWDLGAGSGRDVCFLAEQLREHLRLPQAVSESKPATNTAIKVVGLDQRYQKAVAADEECNHFYGRRGIGDMTACRRIRLEDWDEFAGELQRTNRENGRVLCLFAVRFWNRPLVEQLVRSPMIAPGTIFAISQFGKPSPDATWDFAHPKVRST
jgi:hypothetical protein